MNMNELIMQIVSQGVNDVLTIVINVLVGALVIVVLKFMIHKFGLATTNTIVKSIEQQMGAGNGSKKKATVLEVLQKSFLGKFMSIDQIDHLIESTVFEINKDKDATLNQGKGDGQDA